MEDSFQQLLDLFEEIKLFLKDLSEFAIKHMRLSFFKFELGKKNFATALYRQRGKLASRFMHTGMASLAALGVFMAPVVANEFPGRSVDPWSFNPNGVVLSAAAEVETTETIVSDRLREKIVEYTVAPGDTIATIAKKFDISEDTIRWQNKLDKKGTIKVGQTLQILPVTGVSHRVQKGDTVYSIAKKYDASPQAIVDFPYNTFTNDETFDLAVGQIIIVPDGVMPAETPTGPVERVRQITPDAGTVVASGNFVWPATGTITQRFSWYHPAIDIANRAAPDILAADSGKVIVAGWPDNYGYGNRVVIDHGNGYVTLYAHLSAIYVKVGQTVSRGSAIGKMGSTGRSTGTHLHFEVRKSGVHLNPLDVLK
jgi:murein DD-endopeptidase MepM/ murein hydrolase activator NlpD